MTLSSRRLAMVGYRPSHGAHVTLNKKMKTIRLLILLLGVALHAAASGAAEVAKDGLPSGSGSPEGAACDLMRAFIHSDVDLLKQTCIKRYPPAPKKYEEFLAMVVRGTEEDKQRKEPHPKNPTLILKLFAARHLSAKGPASYGYAVLNLADVMFVDVVTQLADKSRFVNRTMVVKTAKGDWRVHPCPTIDPLLSLGLNNESESTIEYAQPKADKASEPTP